jgi:SanA protein
MFRKLLKRISLVLFWLLMVILLLIFLLVVLPRLITTWTTRKSVYSVENVPVSRVAIVFGAGLWRDGSPTPVLRDRVATAARLYFTGKVEKILMSGDNSHISYNEPGAMRDYALELGVPDRDIVLDYAGRRTYDTCYRARSIFGLQQAVLVTQAFHLPRALYVCNALHLPAVGVPADLRNYHPRSLLFWNLREIPATLVALWEVHLSHPQPILGKPEPIFPSDVLNPPEAQ